MIQFTAKGRGMQAQWWGKDFSENAANGAHGGGKRRERRSRARLGGLVAVLLLHARLGAASHRDLRAAHSGYG
jgi:hypothetical protein